MPSPFKAAFSQPPAFRTRLLVPVIVVVLLAAAAQYYFGTTMAQKEADALVHQRGTELLERFVGKLNAQRQAKEILARVIADESALAPAIAERDDVGLAAALATAPAVGELTGVAAYGADGRKLLSAGETIDPSAIGPVVAAALSGEASSAVQADEEGLVIVAAAPVVATEGTIGAIVVRADPGPGLLETGKEHSTADLALFSEGREISTTATNGEVRRILERTDPASESIDKAQAALAGLNLHVIVRPLNDDILLVALVPTDDLMPAFTQRAVIMQVLPIGLLVALLLVSLLVIRDVSRPLKAMVSATESMAQGRYDRRVAACGIRELNDMAGAINRLGEQIEMQLDKLAYQAFYDPLSSLPNRALFMDRLGQALARADRRRESVAVMFMDLDNFKVVNDSLGHHAGDEVLIAVADRLQACVRPEDTLARFAGDEFTLVLESVSGVGDATRVAERIARELSTPFTLQDGREVFVTVSIGIALSGPGQHQPDELLRDADLALYKAKTEGKARYTVFDRTLNVQAMKRLEMETDLRHAIERGEFKLHYQPVVQIKTGRISQLEALVRWEHPRRGLILPAEFIPLAEETMLILPIGDWVLREACRQAKAWQGQHPNALPVIVNVNLSARQFQHPRLVNTIARASRDAGLDPRYLKLEITESILMEAGESTLSILKELKQLGVRLAIDDFGKGYSSLSYLKGFPIDALKIDRSFIQKLGKDPEDMAIVRAIITLARTLHLEVTAEGVETYEQFRCLQDAGCEYGQGYYFARPQPAESVAELLATPYYYCSYTQADPADVFELVG
ncbi:MAG: EAL domain-containing protein [Chloroflexi bacterium]|nr:EAL domain-containing protein [Chloroflexota bacterium]